MSQYTKYRRSNKLYNILIFLILLTCIAVTVVLLWSDTIAEGAAPSEDPPATRDDAISSGAIPSGDGSSGSGTSDQSDGQQLDLSSYPQALQELYEKNPDARQFVLDYFEKRSLDPEIDLSGEIKSGAVPLLMQWDERWGYTTYSGNLMGLSGCGPTCLSMAAIYLLQDPTLDPRTIADFATENGYATDGDGTSWTLFSEGAPKLGISCNELPLNKGDIDNALESGCLVACVMGPGDFTDAGHYILLTGIQDGEYVVNDSNSYKNSERTWSYDELESQVRNIWALCKAG